MAIRIEEFYKNLEIEDEDKPRAKNALKAKGVEKHILIKNKLLNWVIDNKVRYSQVASTYRYDKRIRKVLFKFISYLEEFYRAVILDNYYNNYDVLIDEIKDEVHKYDGSLNEALEDLEFRLLLKQVKVLPQEVRSLCPLPPRRIRENTFALKELRNAVMHNKFLLLYRGFAVCYVKGVDNNKSANLKANILNLISFLPKKVGEKCRDEINACKDERDNIDKTRWDLPEQIIISI